MFKFVDECQEEPAEIPAPSWYSPDQPSQALPQPHHHWRRDYRSLFDPELIGALQYSAESGDALECVAPLADNSHPDRCLSLLPLFFIGAVVALSR